THDERPTRTSARDQLVYPRDSYRVTPTRTDSRDIASRADEKASSRRNHVACTRQLFRCSCTFGPATGPDSPARSPRPSIRRRELRLDQAGDTADRLVRVEGPAAV